MIFLISLGWVSFRKDQEVTATRPRVSNSFEYSRYRTIDIESSGSLRISVRMNVLTRDTFGRVLKSADPCCCGTARTKHDCSQRTTDRRWVKNSAMLMLCSESLAYSML